MTKSLEEAFHEASLLPESQQDALAAAIKAEIEAEEKWDRSFSETPDALARLAKEALAEYRSDRTQPLDTSDPNEQ